VAFAATHVTWPGTAALVAIVLVLDLHVGLFETATADEGNRAYAALRSAPPGRVLEIPVYLPDRQEASVYLYSTMQVRRQHPSGYSTLAPREADRELRRLQRAPCTGLEALGVRYLALHAAGPTCGGRLLARDGAVSVYALR
jgi:hypothetical protein